MRRALPLNDPDDSDIEILNSSDDSDMYVLPPCDVTITDDLTSQPINTMLIRKVRDILSKETITMKTLRKLKTDHKQTFDHIKLSGKDRNKSAI